MSNDELKAARREIERVKEDFLYAAERYLKDAVRAAVRELHKRRPFEPGVDLVHFRQSEFPDQCNHCRTDYPCPTITALEDR